MLCRQTEVLIKQSVGQQVRHASKKSKTDMNQTTSMRSNLRRFLGPRNFKGFHRSNPFFFPATNNTTNYMSQYRATGKHRDTKGINWKAVFEEGDEKRQFQKTSERETPFRHNPHTKTARTVPDIMKRDIFRDIVDNGLSSQEASFKFGLSVPRIEAIVELEQIKQKWASENKITPSLKRLSKTITDMVPRVNYRFQEDNKVRPTDELSEIPMPDETRTQRFISIAESEPFGPVDAANVLEIEPASTLLDKLTSVDHHNQASKSFNDDKKDAFYAPQLAGEKSVFRFSHAKVGTFGFRYGAARDDQKHNRKVKYNSIGQRVYA